MSKWVNTETATWHTDDGDEGLGIAHDLDDHFQLYDKVTVLPTSDVEEMMRLLREAEVLLRPMSDCGPQCAPGSTSACFSSRARAFLTSAEGK